MAAQQPLYEVCAVADHRHEAAGATASNKASGVLCLGRQRLLRAFSKIRKSCNLLSYLRLAKEPHL